MRIAPKAWLSPDGEFEVVWDHTNWATRTFRDGVVPPGWVRVAIEGQEVFVPWRTCNNRQRREIRDLAATHSLQIVDDTTGRQVSEAQSIPPDDYKRRAEVAGYDTSVVYYHGTASPKAFKTFRMGKGELGGGIYVTSKPFYAGAWAGQNGRFDNSRIMPLFLKKGPLFDASSLERYGVDNRISDGYMFAAKRLTKAKPGFYGDDAYALARRIKDSVGHGYPLNKWLETAGYIGLKNDSSQVPGQVVVFHPSYLKSALANKGKFNPDSKHIGEAADDLIRSLLEEIPGKVGAAQSTGRGPILLAGHVRPEYQPEHGRRDHREQT